ncbi:MAG: glycosyltransferase family 2 protein [Patescibacteria group bacterium]
MSKTNRKQPLISVVMPAYNAGSYLVEAIESVLGQTYENFEFIIVNDGSTDNTWEIIKQYAKKDKRITAIKNKSNLGVSAAANIATSEAKGKFIARMDADDVSFSDRLEKQVEFLQKNKEVVAVGGQCIVIDKNNNIIGDKTFPTNTKKLAEMIFWAIPIQQPSIMINRSLLPKNFVWYPVDFSSAEDVDLYFRFLKYGQLANLNDWLIFYRRLDGSLSHKNPKRTFWLTFKSRVEAIKTGFRPTVPAVALNFAQIIVVLLLPNKAISYLWYFLRGIRNNFRGANDVEAKVKLGELATLS